MKTGKLWWIADDQAEADQWVKELTDKGCVIEKLDPHGAPHKQIDVIFSLDMDRAEEILGFLPEEESWLED